MFVAVVLLMTTTITLGAVFSAVNGPPGPTITVSVNELPSCGSAVASVPGLLIRADTNMLAGDRACIYSALTNLGTTPLNLGDYIMKVNVTDAQGKSVYTTIFVVQQPGATLLPGKTWDGQTYWVAGSTGPYLLTVGLYSYSADKIISSVGVLVATR